MSNSQQLQAAPRLNWLDTARGLGIAGVVLLHTLGGIHGAGLMPKLPFYLATYLLHSFIMPFFFIITGVLFLPSVQKHSYVKFAYKKFQLIYWPYLIWSLIQLSMETLFFDVTNKNGNAAGWEALLTVPYLPHDQFWFTYGLFLMLIITAAIYKVFNLKGIWVAFFVTLLWFIAPNLQEFHNPVFQFMTQARDKISDVYLYFLGSVLLSHYLPKVMLEKPPIWLLASLLPVLVWFEVNLYYFDHVNYPTFWQLPFVLTAVVGSYLILSLCKYSANASWAKGFTFLGKHSMAIFLTHVLVVAGSRIVLAKGFGVQNHLILIPLCFALGLALPLLFEHLCYRFGLKWLFQMPEWSKLFSFNKSEAKLSQGITN